MQKAVCKARTQNSFPCLAVFSMRRAISTVVRQRRSLTPFWWGEYGTVCSRLIRFDIQKFRTDLEMYSFPSSERIALGGSTCTQKLWIYQGTPFRLEEIYRWVLAIALRKRSSVSNATKRSSWHRSQNVSENEVKFRKISFLHFSRIWLPSWLRNFATFTTTKFIKSTGFQAHSRWHIPRFTFVKLFWPRRWCHSTASSFLAETEQRSNVFPFKT